MRLVSFERDGRAGWGAMTDDGIAPVSAAFSARYPTLRAAIEAGALGEVEAALDPALPEGAWRLAPPVPDPGKIICIGKNYADHALESGDKPTPYPSLFTRFTDTLVAHEAPLRHPGLSEQFDYEGELALVIGRPAWRISEDDALAHVAGYSVFLDGSVRDWQFGHSLTAGKNFPGTGGFGPALVTADEIGDPATLTVATWLNGEEVQRAPVADLIHSIPRLIAYVSSFTPLHPGDVIATGTPAGVGFARTPPLWMRPGDVVEVEIERVGRLRHEVVA